MTKWIIGSLLAILSALSVNLVVAWISAEPSPKEPIRNSGVPARVLEPIFSADFAQRIELKKLNKPVTIASVAADQHGNVYLLSWDYSAPKGMGCSIQKLAADGTFLDTIRLTHEIWEPPVEASALAVGKDGTLYVAVEWPIRRGGLIAVDDNGNLVSKLVFRDFIPHKLAVDDHGQVWVLGEEIDPIKAALERSYIPVNPVEGEQLRVYSPDLKHSVILVRGEKEGILPSTLKSTGDEIVYYASGTNAIRVFRQGQLVRKLTLPALTPLTPPEEVLRGGFKTLRFITGVYKIGDRFLVAGFYNYKPTARSGGVLTGISRNFIALVSQDGEAASPEFEPPDNVSLANYSDGHFIAFSGSRTRGTFLIMKLKPAIR